MKKLIVALLFALLLCCLTACGKDDESVGKNNALSPTESLTYELNADEQSYIIKGVGEAEAELVVIPEKHEGKAVVGIGANAFKDNAAIKGIVIPVSVKDIGENAFSGCTNLTAVYYKGLNGAWEKITVGNGNDVLSPTILYFYADNQPSNTDYKFWHVKDGKPSVWGASEDAGTQYCVLEYINAENGSIEGVSRQNVAKGESGSEVTAIPNENYLFVKWSDGVTTASRTDIANANLRVYPIFAEVQYSVTYKGVVNGSEIWSETVSAGLSQSVDFTAPSVVGYSFSRWENGGESLEREDDKTYDGETVIALYDKEFLELPVISITTEDNAEILSKEEYVKCSVSILNTQSSFQLDSVSAGIRGRGNTTWGYPKKPYRIKFDKKQSLFGSSYKQKSWTLIANYLDKSLSRNAIAFEMSKQFDDIAFSSVHEFVDVYLNEVYMGVYLLCDQMQTGTGRVDIDESFSEDGNVGYLLELDERAANEGTANIDYFRFQNKTYAIKTPETDDDEYLENPNVYIDYITTYLNSCHSAFESASWEDVTNLIDVNSFVDTYIINELFANVDVANFSFYLYKDKDGKLFCGPVWDYDFGAGNCNYQNIYSAEAGECVPNSQLTATDNYWYNNLYKFEQFRTLVYEKLFAYEERVLSIIGLLDSANADGYYQKYTQSLNRNFEKWQIMGKDLWPNTDVIVEITTVDGQLEYLKRWLSLRYAYLCEYYTSVCE